VAASYYTPFDIAIIYSSRFRSHRYQRRLRGVLGMPASRFSLDGILSPRFFKFICRRVGLRCSHLLSAIWLPLLAAR
jgi:hypothetical protein